MNRILVLSVFTLTLILSACSGTNDEAPSAEVQSNSEATDLENENEALRKELAEKENKELKAELEAAEEDDSEESSNEDANNNSSTTKGNESDDDTAEETTEVSTSTPEECVLNLFENCRNDFTDSELMEAYYVLAEDGKVVNFGTAGGITLDHIIEVVRYHDEHGVLPSATDLMGLTEEEFEMYEAIMTSYLHRLAMYYDYDDYQDIFEFLKEGSPAHTKLIANKESGNFENHVTHDVILLNVEPVENGLVKLNVNRVYEHKTSNGPNITNVDYYMNPNTHEVIDYEAISNEPYHHLNL